MSALDWTLIAVLLTLNTVSVVLVSMSLPGTWLILLATALFAWLRRDHDVFGVPTLLTLGGLALFGEVLELVTGAWGSKKAGGTVWGAGGAMLGGVIGGVAGTLYLPVIGSILGAAVGAFAGALVGERVGGRDIEAAAASGRGAFFGRLLGSFLKLTVAMAMWAVVVVAAFL